MGDLEAEVDAWSHGAVCSVHDIGLTLFLLCCVSVSGIFMTDFCA